MEIADAPLTAVFGVSMDRKYILTAEMDVPSILRLDGLRREHFPSERNHLPAHLSLFHRPSSAQTECLDCFEHPTKPVAILFDAPIVMGVGIAFRVRSYELERMRAAVRSAMGGEFSRQDSQGWRSHVTIQNKGTTDAARGSHQAIEREFAPRAGAVVGLLVWEYLGGPSKLVRKLPFDQETGASDPPSQTNF